MLNIWKVMNSLFKKDIADILQVNIINWPVITWIRSQDILSINQQIQSVGATVLLILTILFTLFKFYRAYEDYNWKKKDRLNQ